MTTLKLNQIVALEKGAKATTNSNLTRAYHTGQKTALFAGQTRDYKPLDDEGDTLPSEPVKLQLRAGDLLTEVAIDLTKYYNLVLSKDCGNQIATADVVVDREVLLPHVPVPTLLFLEKQVGDLIELVKKLPVLDPAENWTLDTSSGVWRSDPSVTTKTKKVPQTLVKAAATDKHPAQVEVFHEDRPVGRWTTVKLSGAQTDAEQRQRLFRLTQLQEAIKKAREEANTTEVVMRNDMAAVFRYLGWTVA